MKRWNWIDVLIVLILVVAVGFAAGKFLFNQPEEVTAPNAQLEVVEPNLRIVVSCRDLTHELAESIVASLEGSPREINEEMVEPTRLLSGAKRLDGHVTAWEIREPEDGLVELRLTEEADAQFSNAITLIGVQEIRIGNSHFVKTMGIEIQGIIVSITELSK